MKSKTPISPPTKEDIIKVDKHVGSQLRKRRKEMGLTQQKLAENLGISYQQIQKYETGSNRISAGKLFWLANFLCVEIDFFFENLTAEQQEMITHNQIYQLSDFEQFDKPVQKAFVNLANALSHPAE